VYTKKAKKIESFESYGSVKTTRGTEVWCTAEASIIANPNQKKTSRKLQTNVSHSTDKEIVNKILAS
jgi:hypothetical protein